MAYSPEQQAWLEKHHSLMRGITDSFQARNNWRALQQADREGREAFKGSDVSHNDAMYEYIESNRKNR